jgi:hypothetical protein
MGFDLRGDDARPGETVKNGPGIQPNVGWENCLIAIVIQWKVFSGLGVITL